MLLWSLPRPRDVPAVIFTDDESVSISICMESDTLVQSLDTDTLLDCTIEIVFDALEIEMDIELEKCKHLQIVSAIKDCQEMIALIFTTVLNFLKDNYIL